MSRRGTARVSLSGVGAMLVLGIYAFVGKPALETLTMFVGGLNFEPSSYPAHRSRALMFMHTKPSKSREIGSVSLCNSILDERAQLLHK
jgi:hypothetical protein